VFLLSFLPIQLPSYFSLLDLVFQSFFTNSFCVCYKWLLNFGFLIIFLEQNGYKVVLNDTVSAAGC